jgi:hypothetical protein
VVVDWGLLIGDSTFNNRQSPIANESTIDNHQINDHNPGSD